MDNTMTSPALCGIVDIGAHSARLEIFQIAATGAYEPFESLIRPVNLGSDVFREGSISPENINLLCTILSDFAARMAEYQVENIRVVATSAIREAFNRELVADRVFHASGLEIEILEAQEESRLLYLGTKEVLQRAKCFPSKRALIFVVGTGSLIIMYLDQGHLQFSETIPLGSMRLGDEYGELAFEQDKITSLLENFCMEQRLSESTNFDPKEPMSVIGLGAGVRALIGMKFSEGIAKELVFRTGKEELAELIKKAVKIPAETLVREYHIGYAVASYVAPTAGILGYFLHEVNCREAIFPAVTTRSALIAELVRADKGEHDPFRADLLTAAENIGRKYGLDVGHAAGVADLGLRIFDKLKRRYGLTARHRLDLEIACMLHDVGRFIDPRQHHRHSLYLINNAQLPGISDRERQVIAMTARYHRKSVPKSSHPEFVALGPEENVAVLKLAAILRVADALQTSGGQRLESLKVLLRNDELVFRVSGSVDIDWEKVCINKKGDLFHAVYGLSFKVEREAQA